MAAEKNFENHVKDYLKSVGVYPFGTPNDKMVVPIVGYWEKRFANRNTKAGMPDMHIVIRGRSLEAEIKQKNGKPSALQLKNINLIRESGGLAIVLYPNKFEDFKLLIDDLIAKRNYEIIFDEQKCFDKEGDQPCK